MHKDNADGGFTARGGFDRSRAGLGILRDVGVELLQVVKGFVFAHDLHQRRQGVIGRAGRVGIGDLNLAFKARVE